MLILTLLLLLGMSTACSTDADCNLNGVCTAGACHCDKPWGGSECGSLQYKTTPSAGKNLYNTSDPHNTWNGPIIGPINGKYHIYDPLYKPGSLGGPLKMLHGTATSIYGPWDWTSQKPICSECGENPAVVLYPDPADGNRTLYSIWVGGKIRVARDPDGPFEVVEGAGYPGGNPAPIYHAGKRAFFLTNQKTTEVYTTARVEKGMKWTTHATIPHNATGELGAQWHTEDPFMWVDARGRWHIIGHAYDNLQYDHCGASTLSSHFFSPDGADGSWRQSAHEPYSHTVAYDDGTSHTYTTLERPNLHFSSAGFDDAAAGAARFARTPTHLNLAADLVTQGEGCAARTKHAHFGHTPCDNW